MKYLLYIIIGLAAVALFYFGIFNRKQPQPSNNQQIEQPVNTVRDNWETKTDDQPPVTIKITPVELGKGTETWKFQIVFDTHSGSLDDDLLAAVSLVDDKGNIYQKISWEGPGPGGHHREGTLAFNPIQPPPKYVELKIKDVGGVLERSFRWNIE